jgi:hypothetical protein
MMMGTSKQLGGKTMEWPTLSRKVGGRDIEVTGSDGFGRKAGGLDYVVAASSVLGGAALLASAGVAGIAGGAVLGGLVFAITLVPRSWHVLGKGRG